jgi:uncharacterized protein CbrC (UPF0167 family)
MASAITRKNTEPRAGRAEAGPQGLVWRKPGWALWRHEGWLDHCHENLFSWTEKLANRPPEIVPE